MAEYSIKEGHNGTISFSMDNCMIKDSSVNTVVGEGEGVKVSVTMENYALCVVNFSPATLSGAEILSIDLVRVAGSGDDFAPKASIYINNVKAEIEPQIQQISGYSLRFDAFEYGMLPWATQQDKADDVRQKLTDNFQDAFGGNNINVYHYTILNKESVIGVCGNANIDDVVGEGIIINPYGFFDFFTNEVNELPFAPVQEINWNYIAGYADITGISPWELPEERIEKDTDEIFSWYYSGSLFQGYNIKANLNYEGDVSDFSDWIFDIKYVLVQILAEWDLENLRLDEIRFHRFKGIRWDVWLDGDGKATSIFIKVSSLGGDIPDNYDTMIGAQYSVTAHDAQNAQDLILITGDEYNTTRVQIFNDIQTQQGGLYDYSTSWLDLRFKVVDLSKLIPELDIPVYSKQATISIPPNLPENESDFTINYYDRVDDLKIDVLLVPHLGLPPENDDYDDSTEDSDDITESEGYNGIGLLTKQYEMTKLRCQQLGYKLWEAGFIENIKLVNNNPIENVIGLKVYPFDVSGSDEEIILGNVPMGVNGGKIESFNNKVTIGSTQIEGMYNSFLDFAPFTKITIWLPFIGFKDLDTSACMYKTLTVRYIRDIITGACKADLLLDGKPWQTYDGEMGIDINLMSSNRAAVEAAFATNAASSVVSGISDVASGDVAGFAQDVIGLIGSAQNQYHTTNSGVPSPSCAAYQTRDVFLIYDRPTYQDLKAFNRTYGRMCMLSRTIGGLTGYTVCSPLVDLSGITATSEEKEDLVKILSSGFFA